MKLCKGDALVVVDVQNDFAHPKGTLYVSGGETVIPIVNLWVELFKDKDLPVFFTQDWHPSNHSSFTDYGGIWPAHCIESTWGAEIHSNVKGCEIHILKGEDPRKDEYSGFDSAMLELELIDREVTRIFVCGLATDYCVFHTVIDGLKAGFDVYLIKQGIRGVNLHLHKEGLHYVATTDSEIALGRMVLAGVKII